MGLWEGSPGGVMKFSPHFCVLGVLLFETLREGGSLRQAAPRLRFLIHIFHDSFRITIGLIFDFYEARYTFIPSPQSPVPYLYELFRNQTGFLYMMNI
ncbi:hypothetical protein H6H03_27215 [Nostoc paludosum FACHB-159]|uniref:Uncharacterized protein n=1 Tax=Nostoc paludosum FACHB-159 TaxID=2692908 RepID=A0ABR8KER9_9NOSO|nr:hypothetical protein [Nostoc paludosum FACHB-159]